MRQHLQVLTTSNKVAAPLPSSFTANDVRGVIHYLKKKPGGVTLGEAIIAIKKQVFEPRKFDAYRQLGIIVSDQDRFKLGPLGWQLAEKIEPEVSGFREVLNSVGPYRDVLAWAHGRRMEIIVHHDVAAYWREHHRDSLGVSTEKMIEAAANSFFQLCQAAGLGTHIVGKKGQPTRLRIEADELHSFLRAEQSQWPRIIRENEGSDGLETLHEEEEGVALYKEEAGTPSGDGAVTRKAFISFHPAAHPLAEQIQKTLELTDISYLAIERSDVNLIQDPIVSGAMRASHAGFIIISSADYEQNSAGEMVLRQNVLFELAAASVLFNSRLLLVRDKRLPLDPQFEGFKYLFYEHNEMSWEAGIVLLREIRTLNRQCSEN